MGISVAFLSDASIVLTVRELQSSENVSSEFESQRMIAQERKTITVFLLAKGTTFEIEES